jgi:hypothetical protein
VNGSAVIIAIACHAGRTGALGGTDLVITAIRLRAVVIDGALRRTRANVPTEIFGGDQVDGLVDGAIAIIIEPVTKLSALSGAGSRTPVLTPIAGVSIEIDPPGIAEIDGAGAVLALCDCVGDRITGAPAGPAVIDISLKVELFVDGVVAVVVDPVAAF